MWSLGWGGAGHWPLRWKLRWAAAFSGDVPSSELPPRASPARHPARTSLSASVISLLCSPWTRLCLGATGRLPVCAGEAATPTAADSASRATRLPTLPASLHPLWPPAPEGSELRITRPGPALPHPHPTHCLLIVSIQKESTPGRNNSQAPTKHHETGTTQGHHMPWHIDPLQSFAIGTRTSHILQLG